MVNVLLPLDDNDQLVQVPFVAETVAETVTTGNSSSVFSTSKTSIIRIKNVGTTKGYIAIAVNPTATADWFSLEAGQDIFTGIRPSKKVNVFNSTFEISLCGGGD